MQAPTMSPGFRRNPGLSHSCLEQRGGNYNRQQPGPHGGNLGSQLMGSDESSARGLAGTLHRRSRSSLWHSGHSTASPFNTSVSKVCSQSRQVYSYRGIASLLNSRLHTSPSVDLTGAL